MDLAELKFVVDTKQLEDAAKKIEALGVAVSKVNKPVTDAALKSEKLAAAQAKTAEANTKAAIAAEKLAKAQTVVTDSSKTQMSVLEKQQSITSYMADGLSKGMATIMSYGKAAGLAADDLKLLLDTLQTQKKFSGDPFDKSLSGVTSLKNELGILKEVQRLYGAGVELTSKQVRELASDKERLMVKLKEEGASLSTMKTALRGLNSEYIALATSINKFSDAETQMIKQQKDAAKATAYLADADARLAAALDISNAKLDKAGSDALVKYEKALRQTGMSSEEAAAKLAKAKTQFDAIADKKQADKLEYLARAISVQMGDVGISLASGMNPLLVMIQQGDQIRGAIQQAGASGKELEKAMSNAAVQIASSFALTGVAIGGFLINAVKGAGKSITKLAMDLTGTEQVLEKLRYNIALMEGSDGKLMKMFKGAAAGIEIFTGIIFTGAIVALVALGVALKEVIAQESALSKAVNISGASLGLTTDSALTLAEAYAGTEGSIGKYVVAITEAAKAGNISSDSLKLVTSSAINLQKAAGVSIEATIKEFSKLADKPTTALIELAKTTGLINPKILEMVDNLERSGKKAEAAALATKEYATAINKMSNSIKDDMGYLESFFKGIGSAASSMWDSILNVGRKGTLTSQLEAAKEELKSLQNGGGGLFGTGLMTEQYRKNSIQVQEAIILGIENEIEAQKKLGAEKKKAADDAEKFEKDRAKRQAMGGFSAPKDLELESIKKKYSDNTKIIDSESNKLLAISKAKYTLGLSDIGDFLSEEMSLISDQNKQKLDENDAYLIKLEKARKSQEAKIRAEGARAQAAVGFDKQEAEAKKMQDALEKLNEDYKNLTDSVKANNEVLKDKSIEQQTKAIEQLGQYTKKVVEGSKDFIRTQDDIIEKRKLQMDLQNQLVNLSGADAERVKAQIAMEQSHIDKLSELEAAALKAGVAFSKIKLSGLDINDPKYKLAEDSLTAAQKSLDEARTKSKTAIVKAGIDAEVAYYKQEYERISNSVTDSIVTALFEGGKAGSKKLRNLIIAELKKPITIVVKALVDATLGSFAQGALSGASGSTGSSFLGSTIGNAAASYGTALFGSNAVYGAAIGTTNIAAGSQAAMLAQQTGVFGAQGAYATAQAAGTTASASQMAMTAGPYVLAAVAALNALGVFRSTKTVGGGITGTLGAGDLQAYDLTRTSGTLFRGPDYNASLLGATEATTALDTAFIALRDSAVKMSESVGFSVDNVKVFTMAVGDIKVHPDIEQLGLVLDGLSDEQRVAKINEVLTKSGNAIAELILGVGATFDKLKSTFDFFYQNFYSEAEKTANLSKDLTSQFEKLNLNLPTTREEFKQMVLTAQKVGDTSLVKSLLDLQYSFADLVPVTEEISDSVSSLTEEALKYARSLTEANRITLGAGAYTASDFYTGFATSGYSNTELYNQVLASPIMSNAINSMNNNDNLVEAINSVQNEILELRYEVQADATHNAKTATILTRVVPDGQSLNVTATIDGGVV